MSTSLTSVFIILLNKSRYIIQSLYYLEMRSLEQGDLV